MIKHQVLIILLCIVIVGWVAYRVKERKRSKENNTEE